MNQSASTQIDLLLDTAKKSGSKEDLANLWKATLGLNQWHFITTPTESLENRRPFIGVIDSKPWVFVFTDRQKAQEYGSAIPDGRFVDENGSVLVISMNTQNAIDYILRLPSQGVYGMRINEQNGWFSPLANLQAIIDYTK